MRDIISNCSRLSSEMVTSNCTLAPKLRFHPKSVMLHMLEKMHLKIHSSYFNTSLPQCALEMCLKV